MNIKKIITLLTIIIIMNYNLTAVSCFSQEIITDTNENNIIYNELKTIPMTYEISDNYTEDEYIPRITINKTEKVVGEYRYYITEKEFKEFVRVVEAEVTGDNPFGTTYDEAFKCKLAVAQVILNRVESPHFPDTVHDVIFQKNAFTPLVDGRYYEVEISQVTIDACKAALLTSTKDLTYGCEFFSSGTKECKYGSYVFTDTVGHSFFKSYRKV